ncbi:type II toxin-antitoxin system RelE/ParE family toxin [Testudinibacter aquarius]|uniref:Toxin n=1 Tax=Testudinibacter aquarius TaxID=1524974 RepID=A0A4R3XZ48_9PAST|nr:type II toxin-antitoxin system RelE/ParE family toxin [Testudinibacter aquarius]KAE9528429.1 hypothetical protein A1D24_09405 [Testudinibacter aquarius]TCV84191.1 toxin ParE1/3/4 [Testudinibacter aquarius]TNG92581.1 type II toxin-antitoxin system RelE/ParE family toxin [Testudinibacter aquarius]
MTDNAALYHLSVHAKQDLIQIRHHSKLNWGEIKAQRYLNILKQTLSFLALNPALGKKRIELGDDVFSFPCESHIIYYIKHHSNIVILAVLHKRMVPKNHLSNKR